MFQINCTVLSVSSMIIISLMLTSCKKEDAGVPDNAKVEWMRLLDENVSGSTEDDAFLGENGKVITDEDDNIFLYYYSELPKQTVVLKYDPEGILIWKKVFPDCIPMDLALKPDGSLALAVRDHPGYTNIFVIYEIKTDGSVVQHPIIHSPIGASAGVLSCSMLVRPDNHLVICGVYLAFLTTGFPLEHEMYFLELSPTYSKLWNVNTLFVTSGYPVFEQNSIAPIPGGKYVAQFSSKTNTSQSDSLSYKYLNVVITPFANAIDTIYEYQTGYYVQSDAASAGYFSRYANGLIQDADGSVIHHFSAPVGASSGFAYPAAIPSGFLRIGADAKISDTIPIKLPDDYRILSCSKGGNGFLMTAYKSGGVDVTGDFGANQTLFIRGNHLWQTTETFRFQEFYSDFFPSSAPTSDGGYILMGKIQSFNGPNNKLILIKWKKN